MSEPQEHPKGVCDDLTCQDCCDHDFDVGEGYECINCGMEGFEQCMSAAYDRQKDARKYGDT
jgi:hypothetical protein